MTSKWYKPTEMIPFNSVFIILQHEDTLGLSMSPMSSRHSVLDNVGVFSAIFGSFLTILRP